MPALWGGVVGMISDIPILIILLTLAWLLSVGSSLEVS